LAAEWHDLNNMHLVMGNLELALGPASRRQARRALAQVRDSTFMMRDLVAIARRRARRAVRQQSVGCACTAHQLLRASTGPTTIDVKVGDGR
jgi:hypothetical protein